MKIRLMLVLALLMTSAAPSARAAEDGSFPVAEMKWSRTGATATTLPDGRILVTGGAGRDLQGVYESPIREAEIYDPATDAWVIPGSFGVAGTPLTTADGRVLMLGSTDAQYFDPIDGSFSAVRPLPAKLPGANRVPLLDGRILVTGGCCNSDGKPLPAAGLFDPQAWAISATSPMRQGRTGHSSTLLPDGRVLVVAGLPHSSDMLPTRGAEIFDPSTGVWSLTSPNIYGDRRSMNQHGHQASRLADGSVLITGGCCLTYPHALPCVPRCETPPLMTPSNRYDAATDTWLPTAQPAGRFLHQAVSLPDGRVVVIAGATNTVGVFYSERSDTEIYFPDTGLWSSGAPLSERRARFAASVMHDGRIFVAGGSVDQGGVILRSAEIISVRD